MLRCQVQSNYFQVRIVPYFFFWQPRNKSSTARLKNINQLDKSEGKVKQDLAL